ncbi:MAG: YidC/Oxa1 family membrane protein insertase [Bacilli bacterium]|nr:YidC/Oxa1 family membrane protein insertase [Bacilli bacterium]
MKKNKSKFIILALCLFLLTGCAKTLTDENKKVVKYSASIICDSCTSSCDKEDNDCLKKCETNCNEAKKNQTGQNLTKNILCQPTNKDVIEIYEKYGVSMKNIPTCPKLSIVSGYEGLWVSLFVKPLAWIIIKTGLLLKNYGLSLVIISILIRAVLMPLTKKTAMQSENLKKAQPELDRLNKKYENKNDKDSQLQKSQETLLIYQKYGINPMSSCLFALIQIPLLFAFIEAINRTPAIFEGKFLGLHLGITPLTALKNGQWYYLLVIIILAVITYLSLNLNKGVGAPGADTQKQMNMMNKFMLVFITYASLNLSTAICMYWISSSAFTIFQNLLVKRVK